ncbi:hypothetical protein R1sor_022741 [Riccia sorocarpa]|uniref:Uncharacterized protein n=1 Tax=Riccia sorocarpa TaxID=122646 RepID=A0ABD3GKP0_9MARC
MDKQTFWHLFSLLEDHPIFINNSNCPQTPAVVQLAVALDRLGHEGNGACIDRSMELWGVSHGSLVNFTRRVLIALEDVLRRELEWPRAPERHRISEAFANKGFPGYVGLIDGTLDEWTSADGIDGYTAPSPDNPRASGMDVSVSGTAIRNRVMETALHQEGF